MTAIPEFSQLAPLATKLVAILATCLLASFFSRRIFTRLSQSLAKTTSHWDDTFIQAARPVISVGIALLGFSLAVDVLIEHFAVASGAFDVSQALKTIRQFILIVLLYALLMRYLRLVRDSFQHPHRSRLRIDTASAELMIKLLQLGLTIATGLTLLQNIGVSISGLLAFGGVGGLAVGLAAKDMLANLFGGLTLYMDRPFVVGEKVHLKEKSIEGFVEHIGWRQTRIRGYDRTPVYVPNALFTNMAVINPSRMQNRRIDTVIGLRYQDFKVLDQVTARIEFYLQHHPELDQERGVLAKFTDFGASSLDIRVRFYTNSTDWNSYMKTRHDILLAIGRIIHEHGADIAFPTRTLDFPQHNRAITAPFDDGAKPD